MCICVNIGGKYPGVIDCITGFIAKEPNRVEELKVNVLLNESGQFIKHISLF